MSRRGCGILIFPVLFELLTLGLTPPSQAEVPAPTAVVELSEEQLNELVQMLEDPQRREVFVSRLKQLVQLREAGISEGEKPAKGSPEKRERKRLIIEDLSLRFESLSEKIVAAAASTASLVIAAPAAWADIKAFLAKGENRDRLFRLLADTAASILIALIVGLLLRRYVPGMPERRRGWLSRVAQGCGRVILVVSPYAALLISLFILLRVFPAFLLGQTLVLLFFLVLFFYRAILCIFDVLLSPREERTRVLNISDENANYLWIWLVRFTNYTAFYVLVTQSLAAAEIAAPSYSFVRGVLLIVFAMMLSAFILQIAREVRIKYEGPRKTEEGQGEDARGIRKIVVRYWHILALAYTWAIFIFLIIHFQEGFRYLFAATLETAVTAVALVMALWLLQWLFGKLFAINERVKERFPGLEARTNRYIRIIQNAMNYILLIIAVGITAYIWGIPVGALVASQAGSMILFRGIAIAITVAVVIAVIETSQFISDYILREKKWRRKKKEPSQKMKTLVPITNTALKIAAAFIGGIVVLDRLGVNTTPILAGAGIVGLAVGFGSQTLVKDLINGLFILFEDSIRVGDVAVIGGKGGVVEEVGLRTLKMRDLAGNMHVIPNSSIDTVMNMTKDYSRYVFNVGVAYREDVDEVMAALREIGHEMQNDPEFGKDILEPLEILGVDEFADSAVVIKARITTKPIRQWAVGREFNRRMKKVFDERGIEIPFPHRTIYMGEPKEGSAPAVEVRLKEIRGGGGNQGTE